MFTELALSIHEKDNPKTLTDRVLKKVSDISINHREDPRGRSINMLGAKLGSIPVIRKGRLTHHPHVTRYVYFYEMPTIEDPLQVRGIAIDGRSITQYEYRQGEPDSRTLKRASLNAAWELFTQVDKRIPINFPQQV